MKSTWDDTNGRSAIDLLTEQRIAAMHGARVALGDPERLRWDPGAQQIYVQACHRLAELLRAQCRCADALAVLESCFATTLESLRSSERHTIVGTVASESLRWAAAELAAFHRDHGENDRAARVGDLTRAALAAFRTPSSIGAQA